MPSTTILRALVSFNFRGPNGPVAVRKGATYHKDAPQLDGLSAEALEKNFIPFVPDFGVVGGKQQPKIERATAAPGEHRRVKRTEKPEVATGDFEKAEALASVDTEKSKG